ncbi:peroxiredoxin-like family protein [Erythrobacter sp. JK5]|uniref:peroxiredoxin-like family protein n=1 Tax=Erythrobacter sp. JK5 TaxID=2829500 RepID=UPI001BACB4A3|nr:peroxiredoxin-like family protein [Erythrobacter sp. JK5]QUL38707.1 AhpC/TSA family protein [Erythrobacter sp. JK5]
MLKPDEKVPKLEGPLTIGAHFTLDKQSPENFNLLVFYRGKHCPICRGYLKELSNRLDAFTERGINVFAISMDNKERATVVHEEWDTGDVPLVYNLSESSAREWGLYLSQKRPDSEEPDVFSEPGLFLVRPDGALHFACVQNAPFTRPPLDQLLEGIDHILENDYPVRGTLT